MCTRGRTVLAPACEPAYELSLCGGLLFELYAPVCGSSVCQVAVKSEIVATARCSDTLYVCIHIRMPVPVLGYTVDPDSDLRLSG